MKKITNLLKTNYGIISIIVIIVAFSLLPLLKPTFYETHDGDVHLARFAAYYQAFRDGQLIPRWAGNLNYGYGAPVFIFYYPLPGYIASAIRVLGLNWEVIFKLIMITVTLTAPITFYLWARTLFRKEVAFIGSLLYAFAPYHLLNLYVRGDIAEMTAFVFVPLVFLFLEKYIQKKKTEFILFGALCYGLLILSHNGVSLMFSPVFLLYTIVRSNSKKTFLFSLVIFVLGLLLAAFFWFPALYEGKYVNAKLFIGDMFKNNFPKPIELLYSNWGYGPDVRKPGGLSPQIGIIYVALAFAGMVSFIMKKKKNYLLGIWITVLVISVFITLPISTPLWNRLPILKLYEFPWRFTGLSSFATIVIGCILLEKVNNKNILFFFLAIILITTVPFIKVKAYLSKNENYYTHYPGTTSFHGETTPIWTAGDPGNYATKQIELIGGKAILGAVVKKSQTHTLPVNAQTSIALLDNTIYFPGWKAKVDGKQVPIQFQDPNHRGLITFLVPGGKHTVAVYFSESADRWAADMISLIAWCATLICGVVLLLKSKRGTKEVQSNVRKTKKRKKEYH